MTERIFLVYKLGRVGQPIGSQNLSAAGLSVILRLYGLACVHIFF